MAKDAQDSSPGHADNHAEVVGYSSYTITLPPSGVLILSIAMDSTNKARPEACTLINQTLRKGNAQLMIGEDENHLVAISPEQFQQYRIVVTTNGTFDVNHDREAFNEFVHSRLNTHNTSNIIGFIPANDIRVMLAHNAENESQAVIPTKTASALQSQQPTGGPPAPADTVISAALMPPVEPAVPDPFRTGAPGRPTAKHLILAEAKQRITNDRSTSLPQGLREFAESLAKWWEEERQKYPELSPPATKADSIENIVRDIWNERPTKL
jgi:hypothetical protein